MAIVVLGTNYKLSPLTLREKLAVAGISLFDTRKRLLAATELKELVVVSTCHRVEFYAAGPDGATARERLRAFIMKEYELSAAEADNCFYSGQDREAARQLFTVVCGADSMVAGEVQVFGQVQQSFALARAEGTLGEELSRLGRAAGEVAQRVKAETAFTESAVTIAAVAVEKAREHLGSLKNRGAMILGAGDMGILTARALSANGVASILVANRTLSRAQDVAHRLGGRTVDYTELEAQIEKVDALVACTSAPHVLVKKETLLRVAAARGRRPLFIVDLAVPRNVDPRAGEVPGITLFNVDDLQQAAAQNTQKRLSELGRVQAIIAEEVETLLPENQTRKMSLLDLNL